MVLEKTLLFAQLIIFFHCFQNNFGGADNDDVAAKQSSNAYMLVYVRKSALKEAST